MKVKKRKHFCNLEKRNFVQKAMCFIQKDSGEIIRGGSSVNKEANMFYEKLYASHKNDIVNFDIANIVTPTLLQESDRLEGPITLHEELSALKQMRNDKGPGSDAYTGDFFGFFFIRLMVFTHRQGVIVYLME